MTVEARTPIGLVTGALGSGKTTLLRRILDVPDRRYAVLMNEFGEVAVDGRVLAGKNVEIVELAGGCVCCSLAGDLEAAVEELVLRVRPDHILLEATGVAEADALAWEVGERIPGVRLDSVVHVADADAAVRFPSLGRAARAQLAAADIVLVNKVDLVTPAERDDAVARVRAENGTAAVIATVRCAAPASLLFGPGAGSSQGPRRPAPPPRDDAGIESFSLAFERPLDPGRFEAAVASLPPSVVRAKGFVRLAGRSVLFNCVAGRSDVEPFPAERTDLVFIGPGAGKDRNAVLDLFRACEV